MAPPLEPATPAFESCLPQEASGSQEEARPDSQASVEVPVETPVEATPVETPAPQPASQPQESEPPCEEDKGEGEREETEGGDAQGKGEEEKDKAKEWRRQKKATERLLRRADGEESEGDSASGSDGDSSPETDDEEVVDFDHLDEMGDAEEKDAKRDGIRNFLDEQAEEGDEEDEREEKMGLDPDAEVGVAQAEKMFQNLLYGRGGTGMMEDEEIDEDSSDESMSDSTMSGGHARSGGASGRGVGGAGLLSGLDQAADKYKAKVLRAKRRKGQGSEPSQRGLIDPAMLTKWMHANQAAGRAPHPTFQPGAIAQQPAVEGEAPLGDDRVVLCLNTTGMITVADYSDYASIEVTFSDKGKYPKPLRFSDRRFDLGSLGQSSLALATQGSATEAGYLMHRLLDGSSDFSITLPIGEILQGLAVGKRWVACVTDKYCRIFSHTGLERSVFSLPHRFVTCSSNASHLAIVMDTMTGEARNSLVLSVFDTISEGCLHNCIPLPISPKAATLRWLGWSDEGLLATADSLGAVRTLSKGWGAAWVPVFDPEDPSCRLKSHFWITGLKVDRMYGVYCDVGKDCPLVAGIQSVIEAVPLRVPVCSGNSVLAACTEKYLRMLPHNRLAKENSKFYTHALKKKDMALDEVLLVMFRELVRTKNENKALDVALLFNWKASMDTAIATAHQADLPLLTEKLQGSTQKIFKSRMWAANLEAPQKAKKAALAAEAAAKAQRHSQPSMMEVEQGAREVNTAPYSTPIEFFPPGRDANKDEGTAEGPSSGFALTDTPADPDSQPLSLDSNAPTQRATRSGAAAASALAATSTPDLFAPPSVASPRAPKECATAIGGMGKRVEGSPSSSLFSATTPAALSGASVAVGFNAALAGLNPSKATSPSHSKDAPKAPPKQRQSTLTMGKKPGMKKAKPPPRPQDQDQSDLPDVGTLPGVSSKLSAKTVKALRKRDLSDSEGEDAPPLKVPRLG